VLGGNGGGSLEHFGLSPREVPALVGTLGKAFGSFGAFVAGDAGLIETLVQRARTYIYTTALPVAVAAATLAALEVSVAESWRRERVLALTRRFRSLAAAAGLPLADSTTPIQPVLLGGADAAVESSRRLLDRGFFVAAIRPPTVPADSSRLRVALSAAHRDADVEGLVAALTDCLPRA
jgi:8-amino-7-oxononanoate synthase